MLASTESFRFDGQTAATAYECYRKDDKDGWIWDNSTLFSIEQQQSLEAAVRSRRSAFACSMEDLPGYSGAMGKFVLNLNTPKAIMQPPRRYSPAEQLIIKTKMQELIDAGVVYEYKGPTVCAVNLVVAAKKDPDTGLRTDHRMAQDYRSANQHAPHNQYRLHRLEENFQKVGKAVVFPKLDLHQGFLQIP